MTLGHISRLKVVEGTVAHPVNMQIWPVFNITPWSQLYIYMYIYFVACFFFINPNKICLRTSEETTYQQSTFKMWSVQIFLSTGNYHHWDAARGWSCSRCGVLRRRTNHSCYWTCLTPFARAVHASVERRMSELALITVVRRSGF